MGTKVYDNALDLITFSRASGGTYLGSDGLLKTASTNVPRIEYAADGTVKGLLIEEQRTNLVTYSEDFTDASWSKSNTATLAVDATGPDGETSAVTLVDSGAGGTANVNLIVVATVATSTTYTYSVFAKADQLSFLCLRTFIFTTGDGITYFDLANGSVGTTAAAHTADIQDFGNGWYRCSITFTTDASDTSGQIINYVAAADGGAGAPTVDLDGTSSILIYGAQLEAGSFPTSYISTSGSAATRSADIATIPVSDFGYNQKAGTVVVEFASASPLGARTNDGVFSLEVDNDDLHRAYIAATDALNWQMKVGGSSIFASIIKANIADGQEYHIATTWKSGSQSASVDGGSAVSFGTNATLPAAATTLKIGYINVTDYLNGHIKSIAYYPRCLTNTQLQELTA